MLILSRKKNESLMIGNDIEVRVLEITNGQVKLGIEAPINMKLMRKEIIENVKQSNKDAAVDAKGVNLDEIMNKFFSDDKK